MARAGRSGCRSHGHSCPSDRALEATGRSRATLRTGALALTRTLTRARARARARTRTLSRCTSHFALLISGRPSQLTPDKGLLLLDALTAGQSNEGARPRTRAHTRSKAELPGSQPDKVVLRHVRRPKPQRPPSQEVRATQLGVRSGDPTAVVGRAVRMSRPVTGAIAELHLPSDYVSWDKWAPPLRSSPSEQLRPVDVVGTRRISPSLRSGAAIPLCM